MVLTGANSTGALVISTQAVNFGSVTVGQTASASVSVTNNGSSPVHLSSPQITGQYFSLSGQSSGTVTIGGGGSYSLALQFAPMEAGTQTGSMTMTAGSDTLTVALSGTGESVSTAAAALSGLSCASGSMTGTGTDACTVTLTAPADAGGLTVTLASSSTAVSAPATVTVASGAASAGFTATITAVGTAQAAQLTAAAGGVTKSYTIRLGAATPGLTLQSTSVSFGDVTLNTPATQTVLLTSSGTAALTVSAASLTGSGFSLTGGSFPVTLAPGQTATLDIQFDPTAAGAVMGTVTLTTNTSAGTAAITLTGTGAAASYQVDLSWNAPTNSADPVANYDIYRAVSGSSSYQMLNSGDITRYADTTVQSGTAYTYYVVSVDAAGNQSAPSNVFSVTIP